MGMQFSQNCIDVFFIDYMYIFSRYVQGDKMFFVFNLEMVRVQVWQEMVFSCVQCVGMVVIGYWMFVSNLVDLGYVYFLKIKLV